MTRALLALAAVCTLSLASADARANPLDTFGLGSREAAMGGAAAADVSDFSANYYNPAGLARARGLEIAIGYFRDEVWIGPKCHATVAQGAMSGRYRFYDHAGIMRYRIAGLQRRQDREQ